MKRKKRFRTNEMLTESHWPRYQLSYFMDRFFFRQWLSVFCVLVLTGCNSRPQVSALLPNQSQAPPIRFLLTFDDGPSAATHNNPTLRILDVLAQNKIQPNVKAIFFVQTRAIRGGGTEVGHTILRREHAEGHLLAFHTATRQHANHRLLQSDNLESSLKLGIEDLNAVCGKTPQLVRPPFWNYSALTLDSYHRHGLHMLLTDLSANDGVIHGVDWSLRKRSNLLMQLRRAKVGWADGSIPTVDGNTPIVVTFHDVNNYSARNIELYMRILLDIARELNMPVAAKPFYDDRVELEKAALARTVRDTDSKPYLPGIWSWLWQ